MKTYVNLLPWQFRYRMLRRARLRQWSFVWGACLIVAGGLWYWKAVELKGNRRALQLRQRIAKPVRSMMLENERLQTSLTELGGRQSLLRQLEEEDIPFRTLGVVSQSARRCDGRVAVKHLELALIPDPPGDKTKPNDAPNQVNMVLTLDGVATDNLAVSEFVMQLRRTGLFEHVELKSTLAAQGPEGATRSYKIACNL